MLLFSNHRELAIKSGSDDSSDESKKKLSRPPPMDLSTTVSDPKTKKKALSELRGFKIESSLDRQLLMGIFDEVKTVKQPGD